MNKRRQQLGNGEAASLFIPPEIDQLPKVIAFVRAQALAAGLSKEVLWKVELAVEEALVNILKHGQLEDDGVEISCEAATPPGLKITLKDRGIPFAPAEEAFNPSDSHRLDEMPIGGQGMGLIRKCMDLVEYQRVEDYNLLTLVKRAR